MSDDFRTYKICATPEWKRNYKGAAASKRLSGWSHDSRIIYLDFNPISRAAIIRLQNGLFRHQYLTDNGDPLNTKHVTVCFTLIIERIKSLRANYSLASCDKTQKDIFLFDEKLEVETVRCKRIGSLWEIKFSTFGVLTLTLSGQRLQAEEIAFVTIDTDAKR